MRVLLVEDEAGIAEEVREGLEEQGFGVDVAPDGPSALRLTAQDCYAAIILDIMLPGMSGWAVCERLRDRRDLTPILMLTARGAPADRVRGLDTGADDYLPKPFNFPELVARVRALVRRDKVVRTRTIRVADLEMDTAARRAFRGGQELVLTDREYALLEALASREGRVLSREFIQQSVWEVADSLPSTVDAWVYLLRKKVDAGRSPRLIRTVRGVGYVLRAPEKAGPPA